MLDRSYQAWNLAEAYLAIEKYFIKQGISRSALSEIVSDRVNTGIKDAESLEFTRPISDENRYLIFVLIKIKEIERKHLSWLEDKRLYLEKKQSKSNLVAQSIIPETKEEGQEFKEVKEEGQEFKEVKEEGQEFKEVKEEGQEFKEVKEEGQEFKEVKEKLPDESPLESKEIKPITLENDETTSSAINNNFIPHESQIRLWEAGESYKNTLFFMKELIEPFQEDIAKRYRNAFTANEKEIEQKNKQKNTTHIVCPRIGAPQ